MTVDDAAKDRLLPSADGNKSEAGEVVQGYVDQYAATIDENTRLRAEVEQLRSALGYISSPTIGWPGDGDLLDFAEHRATDTNARLALLACIRTARQALGAVR